MENDSQQNLFDDNVPPSIRQTKSSPLEKQVEKRLMRAVSRIGGVSWKFVSENNRGVSDRIVLYNGRTIFVEVKREKGKLSELQKVFGHKIFDNKGEFVVVEGYAGVDAFAKRLQLENAMWIVGWRSLFSIVKRLSPLEWFK